MKEGTAEAEKTRLQALHATGLLDSPPEPAFDRLTQLVCRLLRVPVSLVSLVDGDRQFFKSSHGLAEPWASLRETPLSHSICQYLVESKQPFVVDDTRLNPQLVDNLAVTDLHVLAYLGVPLFTPDDQVIGALCAIDSQPRIWASDEIETLTMLAEMVMTEIRLRHQLQQTEAVAASLRAREEELHTANGLLQGVVNSTSDGIYVRDLAGRYLLVNPVAAASIGRPSTEIIGQNFRNFYRPENAARLEQEDRQVLATGQVVHAEFSWLEDGVQRIFHSVRTPVKNESGEISGILNVIRDITDRKQVEEALRQSEARFRQLADAMPQIVWTSNAKGEVEYINRQWTVYTGLTIEQSIGVGADRAIHPADSAAAQAVITQAMRSGESFEVEFRLHRFDGLYRWHLVRGVPVRDGEGRLLRWYCTATDIDERKRAEIHGQFLIELDSQIRLITEPDEIVWTTVRALGEYLEVSNCHVSEIDQVADRMIVVRDWQRTAATPERTAVMPELLAKFLSPHVLSVADVTINPQTAPVAAQLISRNVRAFVSVPFIQEGRWIVSLVVQQETARHWSADELELLQTVVARVWPMVERARAMMALRASEANYRAIFEGAVDAIFLSDQNGVYLDVNDQGCRLSGYTRAELIGKHLRDLTPIEVWPRLNRDSATQLDEWRLLRKDGSVVPIEVSAKQLADGRWQAFVRDVTERKEYERQLHQLNASLEARVAERTTELEQSNRELDQFAYVASHDLKAPLRGIDHLATWIAQDAEAVLPEASKKHLSKLRARIKRLDTLLDDLLAYSRIGRHRHPPERVDLDALVRETFELSTPPVGFALELKEPLPSVITERIPLETVLRNLIGNALKHHQQPSIGLLQIRVVARGDFIQFAISDNGPGIDPAYHERIFELFQTLQPRDQVEGSGIGLSVVKRLVESRGGQIQVESSIDHGATFFFTWPQVRQ